jgi:AcrR family transcriptional regulator
MEDNVKYQNILSAGRELFYKHGFRRVSVEEICRKANVSKMTYYKFFENKVELAKSVFDNEVTQGARKLKSILAEDITAAEKIKKLIQIKYEGTNDISKEFLQDFYSSPELGLKDYVEEKTKIFWTEFIQDFKAAQEKGWFRKDLKPEFFFYLSQKLSSMVTDEHLLSMYDTPQELIIEFTNFFTYGISPRESGDQ